MDRSTAETLTRVYAILVWFGAFWIVFAALALLFIGSFMGGMMGGVFSGMMPVISEDALGQMAAAGGLFGVGLVILLVILAALAAAYIIIGRAIWHRESWGRTAGLVISILSLLSFPIGTLIGAFGIWLFGFEPTVKELFARAPPARLAPKRVSRTTSRKKKR